MAAATRRQQQDAAAEMECYDGLMAKQMRALDERLTTFIENQQVYFVATAAQDGRVNVSPKGADSLRVMSPTRIVWLNRTGSGNETAAHVLDTNRMAIMFCAFTDAPLILRLYGSATIVHPGDADWDPLATHFPHYTGARQIFDVTLNLVQTSCGFGVPFMDYRGERDQLDKWDERQSKEGVEAYWQAKNVASIDGLPTDIPAIAEG